MASTVSEAGRSIAVLTSVNCLLTGISLLRTPISADPRPPRRAPAAPRPRAAAVVTRPAPPHLPPPVSSTARQPAQHSAAQLWVTNSPTLQHLSSLQPREGTDQHYFYTVEECVRGPGKCFIKVLKIRIFLTKKLKFVLW